MADPSRGLLYAALSGQCRIVAFDLVTGAFKGWIAGTPGPQAYQDSCGFSGDGRPAVGGNASLSRDIGQIDVAPNGDLFFADTGNHRVRRVERATGIITTVAGDGLRRSVGDLGKAVNASLNAPRGVKVMESPDTTVLGGVRRMLYITESTNLRRVLLN